jgi:gluconate 2-dehydrogenase gamma chain
MSDWTRRGFIKTAGGALLGATAIDTAPAAPQAVGAAPAGASAVPYSFLTAGDAALVEALVARLIPEDEIGPGAISAGVPAYIDRQLGGAWGAGERLYRSGPWQSGTPMQGYQLPLTPAELFQRALPALDAQVRKQHGDAFGALPVDQQEAILQELHSGKGALDGIPAGTFFDLLHALTLEGYFSDPIYGGNRNMGSWRMLGFPGAYGNYFHLIDQHNLEFSREPMSLAQGPHAAHDLGGAQQGGGA